MRERWGISGEAEEHRSENMLEENMEVRKIVVTYIAFNSSCFLLTNRDQNIAIENFGLNKCTYLRHLTRFAAIDASL